MRPVGKTLLGSILRAQGGHRARHRPFGHPARGRRAARRRRGPRQQRHPGFTIVGLPDTSCRESRDRVRAALLSSGLPWPVRRVTVNLAPTSLRKVGAGLDLPIAIALMVAADELPIESIAGMAFVGELGLDGSVRRVTGTVPHRRGDPRTDGGRRRTPPPTTPGSSAGTGFGRSPRWRSWSASSAARSPGPILRHRQRRRATARARSGRGERSRLRPLRPRGRRGRSPSSAARGAAWRRQDDARSPAARDCSRRSTIPRRST